VVVSTLATHGVTTRVKEVTRAIKAGEQAMTREDLRRRMSCSAAFPSCSALLDQAWDRACRNALQGRDWS